MKLTCAGWVVVECGSGEPVLFATGYSGFLPGRQANSVTLFESRESADRALRFYHQCTGLGGLRVLPTTVTVEL